MGVRSITALPIINLGAKLEWVQILTSLGKISSIIVKQDNNNISKNAHLLQINTLYHPKVSNYVTSTREN